MYKAIIFDMDGVIIDSEPLWEKSEEILINNLGLEYNPVYRDKIRGLNQTDSARLLKDTFNLNMGIQDIINERLAILLRLYKDELKLVDGVEGVMSNCENKKLRVGLASSSPMGVIEFVLKKFGVGKYFNTIISGECIKNGKPEPDIYVEAAKRLGFDPGECIAVEDSINGVFSAKKAGMYCIAVPDIKLLKNEYKIADLIVKNISEIKLDNIV